ncbi:hypothetical protein Indivirus_7_26 [Indivirus ILV1]|uniref:Uncharacterized protein n=1 Tax=Indivirus ILV1 TaxID=1977633 RepID=A0A1V0SE54_9VIRU|nr:hypothetical protein Indivirus_7_26 [Indivirus ILV1]
MIGSTHWLAKLDSNIDFGFSECVLWNGFVGLDALLYVQFDDTIK